MCYNNLMIIIEQGVTAMNKTNALRILEAYGIRHSINEYSVSIA